MTANHEQARDLHRRVLLGETIPVSIWDWAMPNIVLPAALAKKFEQTACRLFGNNVGHRAALCAVAVDWLLSMGDKEIRDLVQSMAYHRWHGDELWPSDSSLDARLSKLQEAYDKVLCAQRALIGAVNEVYPRRLAIQRDRVGLPVEKEDKTLNANRRPADQAGAVDDLFVHWFHASPGLHGTAVRRRPVAVRGSVEECIEQ